MSRTSKSFMHKTNFWGFVILQLFYWMLLFLVLKIRMSLLNWFMVISWKLNLPAKLCSTSKIKKVDVFSIFSFSRHLYWIFVYKHDMLSRKEDCVLNNDTSQTYVWKSNQKQNKVTWNKSCRIIYEIKLYFFIYR